MFTILKPLTNVCNFFLALEFFLSLRIFLCCIDLYENNSDGFLLIYNCENYILKLYCCFKIWLSIPNCTFNLSLCFLSCYSSELKSHQTPRYFLVVSLLFIRIVTNSDVLARSIFKCEWIYGIN